jgi:hypothetical protein
VGGAVGKNQLFCILFKIGSLDFFIFCIKFEGIKEVPAGLVTPTHFVQIWICYRGHFEAYKDGKKNSGTVFLRAL